MIVGEAKPTSELNSMLSSSSDEEEAAASGVLLAALDLRCR
jgi:hypothetical protein